jgi:hypothetical protein
LFWLKSQKLEDIFPSTLGRVVGGALITNRFIFNSHLKTDVTKTIATTSALWATRFVHVSYGQAMLSIAEGVRSLENILFSMITGINAKLDSDFYMELESLDVDRLSCYNEYSEFKSFLMKLSYFNTKAGYYEYKNKIL